MSRKPVADRKATALTGNAPPGSFVPSDGGFDSRSSAPTTDDVDRVLFEIRRDGAGHGHVLRVVERPFADGSTEIYLETWEPGGCGCRRTIALSEAVHLLLNVTDGELWTLPNRDADAAGHAHQVPPGIG